MSMLTALKLKVSGFGAITSKKPEAKKRSKPTILLTNGKKAGNSYIVTIAVVLLRIEFQISGFNNLTICTTADYQLCS